MRFDLVFSPRSHTLPASLISCVCGPFPRRTSLPPFLYPSEVWNWSNSAWPFSRFLPFAFPLDRSQPKSSGFGRDQTLTSHHFCPISKDGATVFFRQHIFHLLEISRLFTQEFFFPPPPSLNATGGSSPPPPPFLAGADVRGAPHSVLQLP